MLRLSRARQLRTADRKVLCAGGSRAACGVRALAPGESVWAHSSRLKTKAESALSPFLPTFAALCGPHQMRDPIVRDRWIISLLCFRVLLIASMQYADHCISNLFWICWILPVCFLYYYFNISYCAVKDPWFIFIIIVKS